MASSLIKAKNMCAREEEEPAMEDIVGPSREVMEISLGKALSFSPSPPILLSLTLFWNLIITMTMSSLHGSEFSGISMFASPTDESDEEEEGREMMREGWELGWFVHGWRRGAVQCWMRGKHKSCCMRYLFLFNITQPFLFWLCSPYSAVKSDMSDHISLSPFRVWVC